MPVFVTVVLDPLSSLRDFDELRRLQSRHGIPAGVFRSPDELAAQLFYRQQLAAMDHVQMTAEQFQPEPLADPVNEFLINQKRRVDEIERQLGRVIDELGTLRRDQGRILAAAESNARHLGNHDHAISSAHKNTSSLAAIVEQLRKEVADLKARFVTGAPEPKPTPAPSVNGKPHNNGHAGSDPLDLQHH